MQPTWMDLLPQILLAGGGFLVFCLGGFWGKRPQGLLFGVALAAAIGSGAAALLLEPREALFLTMLETGGYGRFFTILICEASGNGWR
jgi:NADH:ubiquinone oxidoreductase subunit 2 (subunit N)